MMTFEVLESSIEPAPEIETTPEENSTSENAILTLPHSVPDACEQDDVEEQETEERGDAEEDDESQRSMFTDCRVDTKQDVQGQGTGNEEVNEELAGAKETLPAGERRISSGSARSGATEEEDMPRRLGAHGPLESTPKKAGGTGSWSRVWLLKRKLAYVNVS